MRPCHRAVANTPPKWFAASVSLRRAMLLSPSSEGFSLWGEYFSRLLCVHGSLRPDDLLTIPKMALSIDERFGFPLPLYPSYEVLTFTSVGLPPTEHISFLSFPGCTGAEYPPRLYPCLRFAAYLTIGLAQNSGPSGSLVLTRKDSSSSASCRFNPAHCNRDVSPIDEAPV